MERVTRSAWKERQEAHEARIDELTAAHRARRSHGRKHPVVDFVFDYYGHTPGKLRRWHPGVGIALEESGGSPHAGWRHYRTEDGLTWVDPDSFVEHRGRAVAFVHTLLTRTLDRPVHTGCFGLHEWAMVYRRPAGRRHESWPLRLGEAGTDAVVEAGTLRCSHYDATRFFTPEGLARNTLSPTRTGMVDNEQAGCLHAGMDLYRWAFKLSPAMPSELVADAFELALEIRTLDMQASPYDLTELGYEPVAIETLEGRAEYVRRQRGFAERGNALRRRLLEAVVPLVPQTSPVSVVHR